MNGRAIRFARLTFGIAGVYGLIALLPMFFAEPLLARSSPAGLIHPEHYYGFLGSASVMQLVYLTIARDPLRYSPLMPVAVLAKLVFAVTIGALWGLGRSTDVSLVAAAIDLLLGLLFAVAWVRMRGAS